MPPFGPVKRKNLIRFLRKLGFEGPYSGGNHQFMLMNEITLRVPNPHQKILVRIFLQEFYVKQESVKMNGKSCERSISLTNGSTGCLPLAPCSRGQASVASIVINVNVA